MTFLQLVTRMMRENGHIRGDTDAPASFSDTAHNATMQIAQIAVQNELVNLAADKCIPYEKTSTSIGLVSGTRVYSLPGDFVGFYGTANFYDATDNRRIFEFPGGLEQLELIDYQYASTQGTPNFWYFEPGTVQQVAFYQIPNSTYNGRSLTFNYETSILVSDASDTIPLPNAEQQYMFGTMCARRFKFMFEKTEKAEDIQKILDNDVSYITARATLLRIIAGKNPPGRYAPVYR